MLEVESGWLLSINVYNVLICIVVGCLLKIYGATWRKTFLEQTYGLYKSQSLSYDAAPKTIFDVPGAMALPVLGTRWIWSWPGPYQLVRAHEAYADMHARYGNIMLERALWGIPVLSLFTRTDIETVLRRQGRRPIRPPTESISMYRLSRPDRYKTTGIVNEQGETWYKLRTGLTTELTSTKTISNFFPECVKLGDDFICLLRHLRSEKTNVVEKFEQPCSKMGFESTCTLILGQRMGFLEINENSLVRTLGHSVHYLFEAMRDTYFGLPFWKMFPTPAYKKLVNSEESIYAIVSQVVDTAIANNENTCETESVRSVFVSMLNAPDIDLRDKKAAIIDSIAAGIQTFGNSLIFLLYLVASHPRCQQKLYEELKELTDAADGEVTADVIAKATYLRCCISETFRFIPTSNTLARVIEEPMELSGYNIDAGTVVMCHTGLACRSEENFKNADKFIPERWMGDDKVATMSAATYLVLPFGVGRRTCPGKRFIEQMMQVTLAKLILEFDIEMNEKLGLKFEFLMAPEGPVNVVLKDRVKQ